jgi:hypothetical protein
MLAGIRSAASPDAIVVSGAEPGADGGVELAGLDLSAATALLGGQLGESGFDRVEARRAGRREVGDEPRVGADPPLTAGISCVEALSSARRTPRSKTTVHRLLERSTTSSSASCVERRWV